jgi:nucleoid DNA-binding protein
MTRSELLVACAAARPELTGSQVEAAIDALFGALFAAIARGDRVHIRRFGVFRPRRHRGTRSGRAMRFRASSALLARLPAADA